MYDIITFGSAAQDIHIKSKSFKILDDQKDFTTGQGICLPFGLKLILKILFLQLAEAGQIPLQLLQNKDLKRHFAER